MGDFKAIKNAFNRLKVDPQSAVFTKNILDKRLLLRLKKSKYLLDKQCFKNVNLLDEKSVIFNPESVDRTDYVGKRYIDRSTLYSFSRPFELLHADVGNLEFIGKNDTFPQYVLALVELFSSKTYTYPMRSRRQIWQKLEQFYEEVKEKRKGKKMKMQVDQEFQQLKIKDLNRENNVEMFSTSLRGGKAFATEQKIRELKKGVALLNSQRKLLKLTPKKIIEISSENMNISLSKKYGFAPERVERESMQSKKIKTFFNMHRLERSEKASARLDRYDDKIYERKRKRLRKRIDVGERVYVSAGRIKIVHPERSTKKQCRTLVTLTKKQFTWLEREKRLIAKTITG